MTHLFTNIMKLLMSLKPWITVANLYEHFALNPCGTEFNMNIYGQATNLCRNKQKKKMYVPLNFKEFLTRFGIY